MNVDRLRAKLAKQEAEYQRLSALTDDDKHAGYNARMRAAQLKNVQKARATLEKEIARETLAK